MKMIEKAIHSTFTIAIPSYFKDFAKTIPADPKAINVATSKRGCFVML